MPTAPPKVRLDRHIDIRDGGSEMLAVGDINGDGRDEFVFMQNVGMLTLDVFKPGGTGWYGKLYTTPEDQALDCVTAFDLDGRTLWRHGAPWRGELPFRTHGGHEMLQAIDLDGDGRKEFVRIRGDMIEVRDGATGRVTATAPLGATGHSSLFTAKLRPGRSSQLYVKPCSDGMPGEPYGCPVVALDENLKPMWELRQLPHVGHTPLAFDVDGDGLDELLVGSHCVNPDGTIRWSLPLQRTHDDRRTIVDVDGDGEPEQVLAFEDEGLVVSDLRGRIKWRCDSDHCGEATVGRFFADRPGLQVMFNNEAWRLPKHKHEFGSMMVDGLGREIWRDTRDLYATAIDWPTGVGPQALFAKPHAADPPDARPFIMDGKGVTLAEFDIPPRVPSIDRTRAPHDHIAWGDWGDYYSQKYVHLAGLGRRILIWTRRDLWLFTLET